MPYKVINRFHDAEDNNRLYRKGDEFPQGDSKPSKERIKQLTSVHPEHKKAFIQAVEEGQSEDEEKETIKAELEALGVSFHPNTGLEKLRDKLEEAKAEQDKKE